MASKVLFSRVLLLVVRLVSRHWEIVEEGREPERVDGDGVPLDIKKFGACFLCLKVGWLKLGGF